MIIDSIAPLIELFLNKCCSLDVKPPMIPFRHYLRLLLLMVLSLGLSLSLTVHPWLSVIMASPPLEVQQDHLSQREKQAKTWYKEGKLFLAIENWQKIAFNYQNKQQKVNQARILTYIALAYSQLGQWGKADQTINHSLDILQQQNTLTSDPSLSSTLAEAFNVQGTLQLGKGDVLSALSSWEQATAIYQQVNHKIGSLRTQINQSRALQQLGLYRRSCEKLLTVLTDGDLRCDHVTAETLTQHLSNSLLSLTPLQRAGWRSLGEVLGQRGQLEESFAILDQLFQQLPPRNNQGALLLSLGQTLELQGKVKQAKEIYQQAIAEATNYETQVNAQLAQLKLLIAEKNWDTARNLSEELIHDLHNLPLNQTKIDAQLHLAQLLIEGGNPNNLGQMTPSWVKIEELLSQAQQNAQSIGYKKGQAYAMGDRGHLYEQLALAQTCQDQELDNCRAVYQFEDIDQLEEDSRQIWGKAQAFTQNALIQSLAIQAPEIIYLWQWQLGRILAASGNKTEAIKVYLEAVNTLETLTRDLGNSREFQFSFQEQVEPVYEELLSLLLPKNNQESVSQEKLKQARQQIEALQAAELNNFFRDICVQSKPVSIEEIDGNAAVLYPIILSDRLVILLSLPNQPLEVYVSQVDQKQIEQTIKDFRYNIVIRSQRKFFQQAEQLYDWLIRPLTEKLQVNDIQTLVFIPNGMLRNIPMSALYDGQQYLIEAYGVSLAPSLTLLFPESLQNKGLNTLFGGLIEVSSQPRFTPLFYVEEELEAVRAYVPSTSLINQEFTLTAVKDKLKNTSFPIVHFATHGQFSSQFEETFLVTWNSRINILELEQLLRENEVTKNAGIELLILSACETAAGDRRAALGLSGFAVRAGARSTLGTLWSVNDQGAALLIKEFYRQLATNKLSKAEALRQAQLALLKNRWFRHPFYWSPYILLGNWL